MVTTKLIEFIKNNCFMNNICLICKRVNYNGYICDKCYDFKIIENYCKICLNKSDIDFSVCETCQKKGKFMIFKTLTPIFKQSEYSKKIIMDYKYNHKRYLAPLFADFIKNKLIENNLKPDIFIPVTSGKSRIKKRGFDHIFDITKELEKITKIQTFRLLEREVHNKSQTKLNKVKRIKNLENAYKIDEFELRRLINSLNNNFYLKNLNVFLIDDIFTTGATLNSAYEVLKNIFYDINAIVIFKS